ncbi:hypothetical protein H257_14808 [Aphanomyces astaci]|uniref:Uncharacterized protein n=1 Tax=Aphanomyces astaci TaxID=112090 RepID=W4FRZ2_APHAT|nr:hypothetical protein H257_14808 [Aphanomyces astaci]ETV69423.1 hypothetical protein H257_14808 [Aphanomyces astaci]|eukprot:XP_009840996.1 hypothetical protein H257_14808 [Aphanomyces astaci]
MQNSQNSQNSQDVHTPTHHYNTRSSPQPTRAGVYTLRADLFVKESVYARDNSGKRLHPHVFEGAQWSNIRASIFDFCSSHMSPKATYVNDPRTWSVSDSPPTLDDFESYISIKLARYHFKPTSNEQAHAYLASHVNSTFTILNATMSLDVVDSCVEELQAVLRYTEDASERVKRSIEFMNGKRRVIQGFMHQMQQAAQHAEVVAAIAAIPNAQDVDHSDT